MLLQGDVRKGALLFGVGLLSMAMTGCMDPAVDGPFSHRPPDGPGGGGAVDAGFPSFVPLALQTVVQSEVPPPPLAGGTLGASADGTTVVASDPDRDLVWWIDLGATPVEPRPLTLNDGDEPGRVIEAYPGLFFVALRSGGAVARVENGGVVGRHAVCAAPRGMAFDEPRGLVHVACATGEVVSFEAATGTVSRRVMVERDLRDVVVIEGVLFVSVFRAAEVLELDGEGAVRRRFAVPGVDSRTASVAWRMTVSEGQIVVSHQLAKTEGDAIMTSEPGGYGGGACSSIVTSALTFIHPSTGATRRRALPGVVLPVDLATFQGEVFGVAAGSLNDGLAFEGIGATFGLREDPNSPPHIEIPPDVPFEDFCFIEEGFQVDPFVWLPMDGRQVVAIVVLSNGTRVVQTRGPDTVVVGRDAYELAGPSRRDTGHEVFHRNTGSGIACASCHPEGGDDAKTWRFEGFGNRRTQDLRGGVAGTKPFHWSGDMADLTHLTSEVFTGRMGGMPLDERYVGVLSQWLDTMPMPPRPTSQSASARERGRAIFEDARVGCASCHGGPRFQHVEVVDVGTGEPFKVPSLLGIAHRAPYMHDGCAATLHDRFRPDCGGGDRHGVTSHLTPAEIDDLVAYLESL